MFVVESIHIQINGQVMDLSIPSAITCTSIFIFTCVVTSQKVWTQNNEMILGYKK